MTAVLMPVPRTSFGTISTGPDGSQSVIISREWYRYLSLLQEAIGGSTNTVIDIDITNSDNATADFQPIANEAALADAYGSQNAGQIEALRQSFDGLDPQAQNYMELADVSRQFSALTPFGAPPLETGSLEAAKNIGYRIVAAGNAVLVAGTVVVPTVYATLANEMLLTAKVVGGTPGLLSVGTIIASTSFVINSNNIADTSTVSWAILRPIGA